MFNLYDNIQALCAEHGTTISGMCVAIGISKSTLSNLKNGRSDSISRKTAQKIADYLDVPLDYVLYGKEEKPPADDDEELWEIRQAMKDRAELKTLFHLSKNATPAEVRKMLKVLQLIKEDDENVD